MGTKNNPGAYDCYANAEPDEPMFILLGRDRHAAEVVRYWVYLKTGGAPVSYAGNVSMQTFSALPAKHQEALNCAAAMEDWARKLKPNEAPGI